MKFNKVTIVFASAGMVAALATVIVVWIMARDCQENIQAPLPADFSKLLTTESLDTVDIPHNRAALAAQAMTILAQHRSAAMVQAQDMLAIAIAFALICFGLALFTLGYESAYHLKVESQSTTRLSVAASAPGLACFALATVVLLLSLWKRVGFEIDGSHFAMYPSQPIEQLQERLVIPPTNFDPKSNGLIDLEKLK